MNGVKIINISLLFSAFFICIGVMAKSIKRPAYLYADSKSVDIVRIEYKPIATTVHFVTVGDRNTFKIINGIYVVGDDGERHYAIGTKGIKLDSLYILYKGEHMRFSIDFDPVAESNTSLDILNTGSFEYLGLHDRKKPLVIPEIKGAYDPEELQPTFYTPDYVEIEGTLHDEKNRLGKVIYANYLPKMTELHGPVGYTDQYAIADENGHFKMRFMMQVPQSFSFILPRLPGAVIAHPGDKIHVDLYSREDAKEMKYEIDGRKSYNRLVNAPGMRFNVLNQHIRNLSEKFSFMSYEEHKKWLLDTYQKEREYARYICWHYRLSPHETQLYVDRIIGLYVFILADTDSFPVDIYQDRNTSETEKERYKKAIDNMDYSYFKWLNPNSPIYVFDHDCQIALGRLTTTIPFKESFNKVRKDDPDAWMKLIDIWKEEVRKITGWEGMSFLMEYLIAYETRRVLIYFDKAEEQYDAIYSLIKHPYNKRLMDYNHEVHMKRKE